MDPREADVFTVLEELMAVLERQQEAVKAGEWEAFAEEARRWNELTSQIDLNAFTNRTEARNKLESLLAVCNDLHAQLSDELSRHSASLVSVRQHRRILHSYSGLGQNTCVSYYIDEKK